MVTRLDWWIGVVLVVLAILAHALVPRYEYQQAKRNGLIRPSTDHPMSPSEHRIRTAAIAISTFQAMRNIFRSSSGFGQAVSTK